MQVLYGQALILELLKNFETRLTIVLLTTTLRNKDLIHLEGIMERAIVTKGLTYILIWTRENGLTLSLN